MAAVTPSGPAAKAGLQPGDVITSIDGRNIKDGDDLVEDISARKVGSSVKLGYIRHGKPGPQPSPSAIAPRPTQTRRRANEGEDNPPAGTRRRTKHTRHHRHCGPPATLKKLNHRWSLVTNVRPGSFADEINLGKGAIITAINKKPVTDEASYKAIVTKLKSKDDVVFVVTYPAAPRQLLRRRNPAVTLNVPTHSLPAQKRRKAATPATAPLLFPQKDSNQSILHSQSENYSSNWVTFPIARNPSGYSLF